MSHSSTPVFSILGKTPHKILRAAQGSPKDEDARRQTVTAIQSFITMYQPHAAREDTDLFPKLRDLVSSHEYDAMAEDFEKKEHQLFGDDGFEKMVDRVPRLEKMGIYNLNQFTPKT
jgi:hemerythrin-like domain-containing protein